MYVIHIQILELLRVMMFASFRACKGVGRRMQTRRAHSTLSAGEVSRAAIYHRQCWLQTCGLVFCFYSPPPQKSSAQPQIGRTAGLEPVRLDAFIGEIIRFSPMRNIGTSNVKTHLSLSTENLQYYGVVTSAAFNTQAIVL